MSYLKHGETHGTGARSCEYTTWVGMIQRCHNQLYTNYARYGGRGISVCKEWRESFSSFLAYIGRRPSSEHSIDRYPNANGNYEPGNVRWATHAQQSRNKCTNRIVASQCVTDLAFKLGVSPGTIARRIDRGWDEKRAVTEPPREQESHLITIRGVTKPAATWANEVGVPVSTVYARLQCGWDAEAAVFTLSGVVAAGRKRVKMLEIDGKLASILEWVERSGTKRNTIEERIRRGWTVREAVFGKEAQADRRLHPA
jgi:hypothetical protein